MVAAKNASRVTKTMTLLQMEAVECGAAALGIVMSYYEKIVPLEELRLECGVSRDGSRADNIAKAGRRYGFIVKGVAIEPEGLRKIPLPVIIHWNFNHFVVLEGFKKGMVYLNDPASGRRKVIEDEFDQSFTGIALKFEPGPDFKPSGEKPNIAAALRKRLKGSEVALLYVVLAGLLLVVPGIVVPAFLRIFVDQIILERQTSWIGALLLGLGLAFVVRAVLIFCQQHYLFQLENKLARATSSHFFWHVLRLPMEFFTQRYSGEIGSRVMLNNRVAEMLSRQLATAVLDVITVAFYFIVMLQYNVILALVGLVAATLNMGFLRYMSQRRVDQNQILLQNRGKLLGVSMGGLQNIETIKSGGAEAEFFSKWAGYQAKLLNAEQKLGYSTQLLGAVPNLLTALNNTVILAVGGFEVMNGHLTIGMLVAFQSLMFSFMDPVNRLVGLGSMWQEVQGDVRRLDDVLKYPVDQQAERINRKESEQPDFAVKLEGYLELKDVSFGYNRLNAPLIQELNLSLKPGSRVALVGGSGSGKSTVAKLVAGLYTPWSGEVLFDGVDRRSIPPVRIQHSVALVDQDICMFEGTIRNNLTMWDGTILESEITAAAKSACIHEDIAVLRGGYEYSVAEGGRNFSGGQRQRLEIARALANNPAVLILDEATSALDALTEKQVDEQIRRRGITCLIIAHRLSTIRDCDEIIVMEKGKVVQRGSHEQMKEIDGPYARLISFGIDQAGE